MFMPLGANVLSLKINLLSLSECSTTVHLLGGTAPRQREERRVLFKLKTLAPNVHHLTRVYCERLILA